MSVTGTTEGALHDGAVPILALPPRRPPGGRVGGEYDAWDALAPLERARCRRFMARDGIGVDVLGTWLGTSTDEAWVWWLGMVAGTRSRGTGSEAATASAERRFWLEMDVLELQGAPGGTGVAGLPIQTRYVGDRLMDPADVAQHLGVGRETVHQWQKRRLLPDPARHFGTCPAWWLSEVEQWARLTGRL